VTIKQETVGSLKVEKEKKTLKLKKEKESLKVEKRKGTFVFV